MELRRSEKYIQGVTSCYPTHFDVVAVYIILNDCRQPCKYCIGLRGASLCGPRSLRYASLAVGQFKEKVRIGVSDGCQPPICTDLIKVMWPSRYTGITGEHLDLESPSSVGVGPCPSTVATSKVNVKRPSCTKNGIWDLCIHLRCICICYCHCVFQLIHILSNESPGLYRTRIFSYQWAQSKVGTFKD